MNDSARPASTDTEATRDLVRTTTLVYRAAHSDPKWAVSELLTEALGTLRAIAIPQFHTGEQAAARASESIERIEQAVLKKLAELEGGADDAR